MTTDQQVDAVVGPRDRGDINLFVGSTGNDVGAAIANIGQRARPLGGCGFGREMGDCSDPGVETSGSTQPEPELPMPLHASAAATHRIRSPVVRRKRPVTVATKRTAD